MKITIEHDGAQMVIGPELLGDVLFEIPNGTEEVGCNCPTACGFVHRRFTGERQLRLIAELKDQPMWEVP